MKIMPVDDLKCKMITCEFSDLSDGWYCSKCDQEFKDTKVFRKKKVCPSCIRIIDGWVYDIKE
jgi:hypothetical protein